MNDYQMSSSPAMAEKDGKAEKDEEADQSTWWGGLVEEWDEVAKLRERIRCKCNLLLNDPKVDAPLDDFKTHELVNKTVERNVGNLKFNSVVLVPVLKRWKDKEVTPSVELLHAETFRWHQLGMREDACSQRAFLDAWALRKLLCLVKNMVGKPSTNRVPLAELVHYNI